MGYTIIIGEAKLDYDYSPEDDDRSVSVTAELASHPDAPAFGEPTDRQNQRWPSYSTWHNFLTEVGLMHIFFEEDGRFPRGGHPGVCSIGPKEAADVRAALEKFKAENPNKEGAFVPWTPFGEKAPPDDTKSGTLARLIWLDYWIDWAVKNCKYPVIANY